MNKQRMTKFMYLYAKMLLVASAVTLIIAAGIVIYSDEPACYEEIPEGDLIHSSDDYKLYQGGSVNSSGCVLVEDIDSVEKKYNRYKLIGVLSILGYLIVQPRSKYDRIAEMIGLKEK